MPVLHCGFTFSSAFKAGNLITFIEESRLPLYFTRKSKRRTAIMASPMAKGICVTAYIDPNVKNESKKPADVGKARASCADVTTYVPKSLKATAIKTTTELVSFTFLPIIHTPKAIAGPIIPIESVLAPSVVKPPCANNKAWKTKT